MRAITGRIDLWDGTRQMVHPSRIVDEAGLAELPAVEPVYGATANIAKFAWLLVGVPLKSAPEVDAGQPYGFFTLRTEF